MQPIADDSVLLTTDEKNFLLDLYDKRRRLLFAAYMIFLVIGLGAARYSLDYVNRGAFSRYTWFINSGRYSRVHHWEQDEDAQFISRFKMWMIASVFIETPIIVTGIFIFLKKAYPLKKDANSGVKEKVPYRIARKEYFSVSEQYYFFTDDYKYLQHEVDAETYYKLNEGDYFYVYRGFYSKFVFEESGKYSIL